ncbi:MAG: hypothetical protein QOI24_1038 [Acidobacteriota bacterium]|nr:hypothetical protein [Acidobacteriota bacterium]
MKRFHSATVAAAALALVSTIAIAAEPAATAQPELKKIAETASRAAVLPGLPLSLSAAFQAVAMTAAPETATVVPASKKGMQIADMPIDGMVVAARINASGELETACFSSQAAADAFMNGAKAPATKTEH